MSSLLQQPTTTDVAALHWEDDDIEQKYGCGFTGGRFTSTNKLLSALVALVLTGAWFGILILCRQWGGHDKLTGFERYFLNHWEISEFISLMFFWAIFILFIKQRKLAYQRKALDLNAVPQGANFVLDRGSAIKVLERLYKLVDKTKHFILLNRIERALSNLRNIGNISDVSNILRTQAEYDEEHIASSYKLVAGFVWAIPVLGFIGTVLGLAEAIGKFGGALRTTSGADTTQLTDKLANILPGLSTAFEVTFVALGATLIVQLYMTHLQHEEAEFLDECNDYCHEKVVTKLRLSDDA